VRGYTKDEVIEAGRAAWWRRAPLIEPSFLFVGHVFFSVTPTGERAPLTADEVPGDGWEHYSACSCDLCSGARHDQTRTEQHTAKAS
jgi:hypothetical protein